MDNLWYRAGRMVGGFLVAWELAGNFANPMLFFVGMGLIGYYWPVRR